MLLLCPDSMLVRPVESSPSLRTVLPRKLSTSGAARLSSEEAVDDLSPAKLLRALLSPLVLPPKSIDMRRLPRPMIGELEVPEPNRLATLPRILPSTAGSLARSNRLLMNERSVALLASPPRIMGRAASNPFVSANSDSPNTELAFETTPGVINAFRPSTRLLPDCCILVDASISCLL
jgi:hypothetical protein